ncbi:MAG: GDSL-type esterase/lipase family protein [Kiritimatiellia bacterium]|jgi:lysophospholipase L1-like esterase|nr:GDSL-type esterase/lipase family protein [Kiritimatiellia bacterium]
MDITRRGFIGAMGATGAAMGLRPVMARTVNMPAKPALPDLFAPRSVVLFQGDSITHGGRGGDLNHYLGHGWQAVVAHRYLGYQPEKEILFANRAVSGDTTEKMLKRWKTEGLSIDLKERGFLGAFKMNTTMLKPDVLSILVGVNDFGSSVKVPLESFRSNYTNLIEQSLAANPKLKIILCQPFRLSLPSGPVKAAEFRTYQDCVAELSVKYHTPFVRFQNLFDSLLAENPNPKYWSWDSVHPTYAAHIRMADFWIASVADFYGKSTPAR